MAKSYYKLTILFALLFVSCRKEEDNTLTDTNSGKYTFSLGVQKAELSSYWSAEDIIGITAYVSESKDVYSDNINRRYKSAGNGAFVPAAEDDKIFYPSFANHSLDFIAYYPYKADTDTTYNISLSDQSNQRQIDLLYSNNAKNKTKATGNIEFVFNHILSRIVINTTTSSSGNLTEDDLQGMTITINNVCDEAVFNLASGHLEPSTQKSSIKMKTEADGSSSKAIILPGQASGTGFTVKLTNGNTYSANFPQDQQFVSGHSYTYYATITLTGIHLSPLEIEDWVITDTTPQEEVADEIEYKTGDFYPNPNNPKTAIGIVYWLKPGTSGKEGKIVSVDTELRNWGDSDDTNLKTSISTGIFNWDIIINNDPSLENFPAFKWCKEKGDGWYLPSRYELHVLNELWTAHREYMNSNIELIDGEPFTSSDVYMASSESRSWSNDNAELYYFSNKGWGPVLKSEPARIRAVKEF